MLRDVLRRSRKSTRLPARILVSALPLALLVSGCYKDTNGSYQAVADANGDLHRPGETAPPVVASTAVKGTAPVSAAATDTPNAAEIGLPFYPAAKPHVGMDGLPQMSRDTDGTLMLVMDTTDTPDQVVAFYRNALPKATYSDDARDGKRTRSVSTEEDRVSKSVDVSEEDGRTKIVLMRMPLLAAPDFSSSKPAGATPVKSTPAKPAANSALALPQTKSHAKETPPTGVAPIFAPPVSTPSTGTPEPGQPSDTPPH